MTDEVKLGHVSRRSDTALAPGVTVFDTEVRQAVHELKRPWRGLCLSGLMAGFGMGASVLAAGILSEMGDSFSPGVLRLLTANAYTVGFILVVLANTDLFTEYTTIAILPVLKGTARVRQLVRLWGLIYSTNLVGCFLFALLWVRLGPDLGLVSHATLNRSAAELTRPAFETILLSATLTGWLMGLLSWLICATRETVSQILFVWIVTGLIGLGHFHHAIAGAIEVFIGLLAGDRTTPLDALRFMTAATTGNILGGFLFACAIRYSVLISGSEGKGRSE